MEGREKGGRKKGREERGKEERRKIGDKTGKYPVMESCLCKARSCSLRLWEVFERFKVEE